MRTHLLSLALGLGALVALPAAARADAPAASKRTIDTIKPPAPADVNALQVPAE